MYLARSERGRTVAVKLVRAELASGEEFRARFRQEVQAARRVGGRWTAPVLDADTEAEVPWLATGYIAGPTLRRVITADHGPLPEESVRVLGAGLAHALRDIHAAGLIHRDLKPSNVLITIDGPRVIDFGIARALETVTGGLTHPGALLGSPGFMSPEQVRGDRVTAACDIFCLGSVLAYAGNGRQPFGAAGSGVHAQMFRIAQEPPDLGELPDGLRELVADCLAKEPARRPGLDEVLERLGDGGPSDVGPWLPGTLVAQLGRHAVALLEAETPAAETPAPETPAAERPGAEKSGAEKPGPGTAAALAEASVPKASRPGAVTSGAVTPGASAPGASAPGAVIAPGGSSAAAAAQKAEAAPAAAGTRTVVARTPPADVAAPPATPVPSPYAPGGAYGRPQAGYGPAYGYASATAPPPAPVQPAPVHPGPAAPGHPGPAGPVQPGPVHPGPGRRGLWIAASVAVVLLAAVAGAALGLRSAGENGTSRRGTDAGHRTGSPSPKGSPTPVGSPVAAVEVPAAFVGTWEADFDVSGVVNTRTLTIRRDGTATLAGDGDGYRCEWSMTVGSTGPPLELGPSFVTAGEPTTSCNPGPSTSVTLLDGRHVRRDFPDGGKTPLTYTRTSR